MCTQLAVDGLLSLRHLCRTIVTVRTNRLKASLWLIAASTGLTAQDEAGFHTAEHVKGTSHSFLSIRTATRCPVRALIVIRQTSVSASAERFPAGQRRQSTSLAHVILTQYSERCMHAHDQGTDGQQMNDSQVV